MSHQEILFRDSATKKGHNWRTMNLETIFKRFWAVTKKIYILHTLNVMENQEQVYTS